MKRFLGLTALCVAAAGCVSVLPEQVVPKGLYRLSSASEPESFDVGGQLSESVTIFEPTGSDLLLGKAIVFEDETGALSLIGAAKWSETLSRQLQSTLIDSLSAGSEEAGGYALNDRFGATTPFELQWEVKDLVIRSDEAVVSLRGLVSEFSTGHFTPISVSLTKPYSGKADEAGVSALIAVTREAIGQFGTELVEAVEAKS